MTEFHPGYELWLDDATQQPCIWNCRTNRWQKTGPCGQGKGYLCVIVGSNSGRKNFALHRLVATYYCENSDPETKTDVDHIDGDTHNNDPSNLRWISPRGNNYNRRGFKGYYKYVDKRRNKVTWCANFKPPDLPRICKHFPYTDEGEVQAREWYLEQRAKYGDSLYD